MGSSIGDMCLHVLTYMCIWIIHICRHNNICLFSCIFVCISNRVISTGTFVHLVHIHVHLKDGMGVDICMRFIFAYAYVHMQIYIFTCKLICAFVNVHICPQVWFAMDQILSKLIYLPSWIIFKFTELLTFVYTNTGCWTMDTGHHTLC